MSSEPRLAETKTKSITLRYTPFHPLAEGPHAMINPVYDFHDLLARDRRRFSGFDDILGSLAHGFSGALFERSAWAFSGEGFRIAGRAIEL